MELSYTKVGDYLLPNLILDGEDEMEAVPLGRFGRLRERYLKEEHNGLYTSMLLTRRLDPHLQETDQQAREQVEQIVRSLMEQESVDEAMKARDQMGWVQAVNRFRAQAEEQVLAEIVYR
jgi:hypothetical protein